MTVKELVTRLLDEPMNAEIYVGNRVKHIDERGVAYSRYMFEIDGVERCDENCCMIGFTNWRKVCGVKDERSRR